MRDKKKIIEAALFIAARPMTLAELYHVAGIPKPTIRKLIKEMEKEYDDHGLSVRERDGFFELHIKDEFKPHVEHLAPEKDFSKATLQTLSLIAYHNPIKQSFVIETRGNRAYDHIKELSGRGFIRLEPEGHTNRIHITKKFLDYFGLTSPKELREYFSDRGVEPPDEQSFEDNVKESGSKEDVEPSKDLTGKKEPSETPKKEPSHQPEPPQAGQIPASQEQESTNMPSIPSIPKEPRPSEESPSSQAQEIIKDNDPEPSSKNGKKQKKPPVKKSVNIKDDPYKSPFSDVIKDDND